jgi:hypothetical protein
LRTLGLTFWAETDNLDRLNRGTLVKLAERTGMHANIEHNRSFGRSSNLLFVAAAVKLA